MHRHRFVLPYILSTLSIIAALFVVAVPASSQVDYGTRVPMSITGFSDDMETAIRNYNYFYNLTVSPDGQWIAFIVPKSNKLSIDFELWMVPASGGDQCLLYYVVGDEQKAVLAIDGLQFSHDSRKLLFSVKHAVSEESIVNTTSKDGSSAVSDRNIPLYEIQSLDIETREIQVLVEGACTFDISDDGRFLVYEKRDWRFAVQDMQADHNGALTVLDMEAGDSWYLVGDELSTWQYVDPDNPLNNDLTGILYRVKTISPDNLYVYFYYVDIETLDQRLYRMPLSGGDMELIPFDRPLSSMYALFSPDIRWILFYDTTDIDHTINDFNPLFKDKFHALYAVDTDTGIRYPLVVPAEGESYKEPTGSYCFSSDGERIFYVLENPDMTSEYFQEYGISVQGISEIYSIDFNPEALISSAVESATPDVFPVLTNYPNPFNPVTTISFTLSEAGYAELAVYNLAGQKVCTLAADNYTSGTHTVVWNGCDSSGTPLSSGVYFSRLRADDKMATHRMTLVK